MAEAHLLYTWNEPHTQRSGRRGRRDQSKCVRAECVCTFGMFGLRAHKSARPSTVKGKVACSHDASQRSRNCVTKQQ